MKIIRYCLLIIMLGVSMISTKKASLSTKGAYNSLAECRSPANPSICSNADVLYSQNNRFYALLKEDGCFSVFDSTTQKEVWSSQTDGQAQNEGCSPRTFTLQTDGIAVIEDCQKKMIWSTSLKEPGQGPFKFTLGNNGQVQVFDKNKSIVWPFANEKLEIDAGKAVFPLENVFLNGHGARTRTHQVTFAKPFSSIPKVVLSFQYLDIVMKGNMRLNAETEKITTTGFVVKLTTWFDSSNWSVAVSWLAHNPGKVPSRFATKVEIGSSYMSHNGNMVNGENEQRSYTQIKFKNKFPAVPKIHLSLINFDFFNGYNQRLHVNPVEVTQEGFKIEFFKWSNTKLYGAGASWVAFVEDPTPAPWKMVPQQPKMLSGSVAMTPDQRMKSGTGDRHSSVPVEFSPPFKGPPQVIVGLKFLDVGKEKNQRVDVKATKIDQKSFVVDFMTWADTIIHLLQASWIAVEY